MGSDDRSGDRAAVLPFAVVSAILALAVSAVAPIIDDAYVYFRYADHLVDGHGWRYNLTGDTGNAATSPLYTMVLAAVGVGTAVLHESIGVAFYNWYAAPLTVVAVVLAAWFLAGSRWLAGVGVVALIALGTTHLVQTVPIEKMAHYRAAGEWIAANAPADASIVAMEIGSIGWHSQRCMVDYLGLLDEASSERLTARDWDWWVDTYQPDYWVVTNRGQWIEGPALAAAEDEYATVAELGDMAVLERIAPVAGRQGLCVNAKGSGAR